MKIPRSATLVSSVLLALVAAGASVAETDPLVGRLDRVLAPGTPETEREKILTEVDALPFERVAAALAEARFDRTRPEPLTRHDLLLPRDLGTRAYHLLVPEGYEPAKRYPTLVAQHGAGGASADEIERWRALASKRGWIVVAPHETEERGGWASSDVDRALPLVAVDDARRHVSIDSTRVFLSGVSRGGHASWEVGILTSDRWAGIAPCVGGPRLFVRPALENLVPVPVLDFQGARDQPALVEAVRETCAKLRELGGDVTYVEREDVGHGVDRAHDARTLEWAADRRRDPMPKRIAVVIADAAFGRHGWIDVVKTKRFPDLRRTRPSVRIRSGASPAEMRRAYLAQSRARLPLVDARIERGNRIVLKTERVQTVDLYLSPAMVDPTKPVTVKWNGRTRRLGVVRMSPRFLVEHVRETSDETRTFGAVVHLR